MLLALGARISGTWSPARSRWIDDDVASFAPGLAIAVRRGTKRSTRGSFRSLEPMTIAQPLRVGIGGPVGSGKTALLTLALCRALRDALSDRAS